MDNLDNEDEDIVLQGSALHEHLHKLGYTDFESVPIHKTVFKNKNTCLLSGFKNYVERIFKNIFSAYHWITQEESVSKTQLNTILEINSLLDDHTCMIREFIETYHCKSLRNAVHEFIIFGMMITSSVYISLKTQYKFSAGLFASTTLIFVSYMKYSRMCARRNLKVLVSLQNELFDLCRKGLRILRYGYKIKLNKRNYSQQFYDLTANRLKYLQPITENLIKHMEHAACICYQVSLILIKLIPSNVLDNDVLTIFENNAFELHGEINYQALQDLYHMYMLTQSEMMYLLGVAYNTNTWQQTYSKMPELKLAYIIHCLITHFNIYKNNLSEDIHAYYNFKLDPAICTYRKPIRSKWQDLYVHLNLTSNKLQLAYGHILSILQDIDNNANKTTVENESVETIMQKLNEAYKEIDAARNFAEFSSLLVAKTRFTNRPNDHTKISTLQPAENDDLPVISNLEPEIMDEVFEEYIKEEYLKPLYQESDEVSLEDYKFDKFLAKNFMSELKEALIDKKKSMSERESKALQRMYNKIVKDTDSRINYCVPTPPPMPSSNFNTPSDMSNEFNANNKTTMDFDPITEERKIKLRSIYTGRFAEEISDNISEEERGPVPFIPIFKTDFEETNKEFKLSLPGMFLKSDEETFIGSGENSEDEIIENDTETNEHKTM